MQTPTSFKGFVIALLIIAGGMVVASEVQAFLARRRMAKGVRDTVAAAATANA